ncbi:hypothetical protein SAMN04487867_104175 [Vreelandella titanicae]|nr:hypothetical protein SAMN04487867_104175 [Halomonas titanicae]
MEQNVFTAFVGRAESFMTDKKGVVFFEYPPGQVPAPGDRVTLRIAPGNQPVEFVCQGRHFDFSEERKCTLHVELDLA